jgi:hypothetical protein
VNARHLVSDAGSTVLNRVPATGAIRNMGNRLDIPASAFETKASYFERPNRALVVVLKQYIQQFGTPHLWWGHTHSTPAKGSNVTFLGKYSLPRTYHRRSKWAPCPCCSLRSPKYFKQGLIAWFPDEGVIRCVGDQCYKKMDPEGYKLAMEQLNTEMEAERDIESLLKRLPLVPGVMKDIQASLVAVEAIDRMRNTLVKTLDEKLDIRLWPEVSSGMLRTVILREEIQRGRGGHEEIHLKHDFRDFGMVDGFVALKPGRSTLRSRLEGLLKHLAAIDFGSELEARIVAMTEVERKAAVKILKAAHSQAAKLLAEAEQSRRFFARSPLNTINNWSKQSHSPIRVHFSIDDEAVYVGRAAGAHFRIKFPDDFWKSIKQLEPMTKLTAVA